MGIPAVFLDRDGTINVDTGYLHEIDDFQFIENAIEAMQAIKQMGYALIIVTNQSGIARGMFTEDQFMHLTEWMDWSLADRGVDLDGIYYCPHHPEGTVEEFRQECNCRKPEPGMLLDAQKFLKIDMSKNNAAAALQHCGSVSSGYLRVSFSRSLSISAILLDTTCSRWRRSSRILRFRSISGIALSVCWQMVSSSSMT